MSFDENWDIDSYREDHENDEHWRLRRNFMERWKSSYPEERLVCLARVFANIEFLGCRYPQEVMQEIAMMSKEVTSDYRISKKTKLQRTFVSASDAAEDRARGTKREGGIIVDAPARKSNKINFIKAGEADDDEEDNKEKDIDAHQGKDSDEGESETVETNINKEGAGASETENVKEWEKIDYVAEMSAVPCVDVRRFQQNMFLSRFGRLVLLVRSWAGKLWNIQSSCQVCGLTLEHNYDGLTGKSSLAINGNLIAEASGSTRQIAKKNLENIAWNIIKEEAVIVIVKEVFIAQNDSRISVSEVSGGRNATNDEFGAPVETSVATKMMKLMGWKGGGLGSEAQGIAEPIKPHLQMVNRAGLGSMSSDIRQIKRAAELLMHRYIASDCLDLDLVFSSDFSKEERAALHIVAKKAHLVSRSYGQGDDRFLVVRKKIDPFSLVQAVIAKGGNTPKYQVFVPAKIASRNHQRRY